MGICYYVEQIDGGREQRMQGKQNTFLGPLLIALGSFAWSFSGMLSKWSPWGPLSIIGGRALLTSIAFVFLRGTFKVRLSPGNWLGALGVMLSSLLFIIANRLTTSANAIVLQYTMSVVVILATWVIDKKRPDRLDLTAAVITLCGVVLCFVGGISGGNLLGDLLALLSAFTFGMVFFAARMPGANPMEYSYLGNLISCVFLLFMPFEPGFVISFQAMVAVLLMGLSLTMGYLLFSRGMQEGVSPVTAAIVANVEPVLNPIWVFLVLGEVPSVFTFLGAALVLCSVTVYSAMKGKRDLEKTGLAP